VWESPRSYVVGAKSELKPIAYKDKCGPEKGVRKFLIL
jgi:hypothetical protein